MQINNIAVPEDFTSFVLIDALCNVEEIDDVTLSAFATSFGASVFSPLIIRLLANFCSNSLIAHVRISFQGMGKQKHKYEDILRLTKKTGKSK